MKILGGKIKKSNCSRKPKGFTLVEVSVVMAIIAIMGVWAFIGYIGAKKEVYVHFLANRMQTDIRGIFINSISTKKETSEVGGCNGGRAAKAKVLRIRLGKSSDPYDVIPYCENSTGALKTGNIDTSDPSEFLNYKHDVTVTVDAVSSDADLNGSYQSDGFIYLVFTSPYGKYYAYYKSDPAGFDFETDKDDPEKDPLSADIIDTAVWKRNKYLEYQPVSAFSGAYLTITFDSDSTPGGITHVLRVSEIGNAELD